MVNPVFVQWAMANICAKTCVSIFDCVKVCIQSWFCAEARSLSSISVMHCMTIIASFSATVINDNKHSILCVFLLLYDLIIIIASILLWFLLPQRGP